MSPLKVVMCLVAAGMIWKGYTDMKSPTPDNPDVPVVIPDDKSVTIKIISDTNEPIPTAPTNPAVLSASAPIRQILSVNPNDAIKHARMWGGWGELIGRSSQIKDTGEFQRAFQEATAFAFQRHGVSAKGYPLTQPINATLVAAFSSIPGAIEGGALAPIPWTAATQAAAQDFFNAIAFQAYQGFVDGHKRVQSQLGPGEDYGFAPYATPLEPEPAEGPEYGTVLPSF